MGNVFSTASARERATKYVTSERKTMSNIRDSQNMEETEVEHFHDTIEEGISYSEDEARARIKEEEMTEFRKQLNVKREQRRQILARHRAQKEQLEKSLEEERKSKLELLESNKLLRELLIKNNIEIPDSLHESIDNSEIANTIVQMKEEFEKLKLSNNKLRKELAESNSALQSAFSDIADLNAQNIESIKHINALKEVVSVSKTMINLREQQLLELKNKLSEIERSLADRETNMLSTDLRQEYERQLQNIRTLRSLYEERARLSEVTRLGLVRELEEQKLLYQAENTKCKNLTAKVQELEATVDALHDKIECKNNQLSTFQNETQGLKAEMTVVNKLFSQVLLGYKTNQDLDKLVHRLEENHGLLTHMAERENGSEASTELPKLLLELVNEVDENEANRNNVSGESDTLLQDISAEDTETSSLVGTTPEEIVQNLPKVWKVLMELLSHQNVSDGNTTEKVTTCYKSVETKSGPVLVPSVSQTYIRLKDLIIEKLGLVKEVNRMKQLNVHLETRLEEQERRLCLVTAELSKTWHVVGRLRRHHHQLHTHEKILKYELQQKRKLLNELKEELEYCREKWLQAREKNSQSERDWRKLRAEFSSRNAKSGSPSLNNSAESGYSDERPSDESSESNDESEYVVEPLLRCKKKIKKSFETIVDSSTDFNLAAEREDPPSDMLDVADLPLDTQDESQSENLRLSIKTCEETEDEIGDITHDSCVGEICDILNSDENGSETTNDQNNHINQEDQTYKQNTNNTQEDASSDMPLIDPALILKNIKIQNERLAKKDEKLEKLEKHSAALLKKTQTTSQLSEQLSNTLDHLLNRPTSIDQSLVGYRNVTDDGNVTQNENIEVQNVEESPQDDVTEYIPQSDESIQINDINESLTQNLKMQRSDNGDCIDGPNSSSSCSMCEKIQVPDIDFKAILENVKKQNERLDIKDKRLQKLEEGCSEVLKNISGSLTIGDEIKEKLNLLHEKQTNGSNAEEVSNGSELSLSGVEPSTSAEIDHEARFAARDLRLKRLEEQTKSLVKKVNKTNSKRVKINYKLEELHSLYGSENSRSGTPSEENDEKSLKEEDEDDE